MEVTELNALIKIVQLGSYTEAAKSLGTTKAYLSRIISQWESRLHARLLDRTTRSVSLTEVGREVYERAQGIIAALEDIERMTADLHREPIGLLKISCGVEFGMFMVSRWIHSFLERYPKVQIEADFSNRLVDIVHEGFDLAIRVGKLPDSSLAARKVGNLTYGLFASPAYLNHAGIPVAPKDLLKHQLIFFSGGSHRGPWHLTKGHLVEKISHQGRLTVNNSFVIKDSIVKGLGLGMLPKIIVKDCLEAGTLEAVLPSWQLPDVPVHLIFPSTRYLTPKVRAFIDLAIEDFSSLIQGKGPSFQPKERSPRK
jgi:LysR family transcriptional regulator for bpeEF and oprC